MPWTSLSYRLEQLPLILSGPILRRTDSQAVTVWVALRSACQVRLQVYRTKQGKEIETGEIIAEGEGSTIALGKHLHIVALTAKTLNTEGLVSDHIYAYDLNFEPVEGTHQTLQEALQSPYYSPTSISYFEHGQPTFVLPPEDLNKLRIIHGSCRKPQGEGIDALPIVDDLLEQEADDPQHRVHQLFMTGDQIYGDDVADALLLTVTDAGDTLIGWEETLLDTVNPKHLKPGQRSAIAEKKAA